MNPITNRIKTGTAGELLVQLRLLQFNVQAAPPLKDSGNDLIAVRGRAMRAIQVKTTTDRDGYRFRADEPERLYHLLAVVGLDGDEEALFLDQCPVFLFNKIEVVPGYRRFEDLQEHAVSADLIDQLFREE